MAQLEEKNPVNIQQQRVVVTNKHGEKLVGLLHETGSREVVVVCHGFTLTKEDLTVVNLATALEKAGISAFRFDFAGHGESEGTFESGSYYREVDDLHSVIQHINGTNHAVAAIVGHSKGGVTVLLYASKYHDIQNVVNVSGRSDLKRGIQEHLDSLDKIKEGYLDVKKEGKVIYRVKKESLEEALCTNIHEACLKIDKNCRIRFQSVTWTARPPLAAEGPSPPSHAIASMPASPPLHSQVHTPSVSPSASRRIVNGSPVNSPAKAGHVASPPRKFPETPPYHQPPEWIPSHSSPQNPPADKQSKKNATPPTSEPQSSPAIPTKIRSAMPPNINKSNISPDQTPPLNPVAPEQEDPAASPTSAAPPLSITPKPDRVSVVSPANRTPKALPPLSPSPRKGFVTAEAPSTHNAPMQSKSPPHPHFLPPNSPPSSRNHKQHGLRNKLKGPHLPAYLASPPKQGPVGSPSVFPRRKRTDFAPPPYPEIPPSGALSRTPKVSIRPPVQVFPPPPPNEDCAAIICTEPLTNRLPGSQCGCVQPMQVGLSLHVALYTFFPSVPELALEIAAGVFMKQSQVHIIGANAASEQPEKTIVLIDLVPVGDKFETTTAFLTSQRFWHKQVNIKASLFGDYEVLYVNYPGLPPSPPFRPSNIGIHDNGPYLATDRNTSLLKPLGVNVPKKQPKKSLSGGMIAIVVLSASAALVLCSAIAWIFVLKDRDQSTKLSSMPQSLQDLLTKASGSGGSMMGSTLSAASYGSSVITCTGSTKTFSFSEIERATNNFDASRILGEGGFGRVYHGVLEDGSQVAVKVLKRDDQQGNREFLAEVEMLSRLHHRNLVQLMGICTKERVRCLIYELIPNGSLECHLHDVDNRLAPPLNWDARMKIALGTARGLAYLHEDSSPRVIHRDFKASNILLEHDFTPKVSDFGLARMAMDGTEHISTRVMGTFGYVAPEYAMTGHLLVKSDVYSYGVVLLELLTGRKPVDMSQPPGEENLVSWARPLLVSREGVESIIDQTLRLTAPFESVVKVAAIASMCVQPEVSNRPFMGEVVQALKLVCNECDETKDVVSRSSTADDSFIDSISGIGMNSGHLLESRFLVPSYDSDPETGRGVSVSEVYSGSASGKQSGSLRRHSTSGPLRTGRSRQLRQKMRQFYQGAVSDHSAMFRFRSGFR